MRQPPPIQQWWVSYVLVGATALIAVLWALGSLAGFLAPVRELIFVLLFGIVFAFLLSPIVQLLHRVMPRWLAVVIAFLGALALLVGSVTSIAAPVVPKAARSPRGSPRPWSSCRTRIRSPSLASKSRAM